MATLAATARADGAAAGTTVLIDAPGADAVRRHCTVCHSALLIAQNRADRTGWKAMIRWMQDSQGLWSLGGDEATILDYLATHYGPRTRGRRQPLAPALLPGARP